LRDEWLDEVERRAVKTNANSFHIALHKRAETCAPRVNLIF
jgi:hypothetical protein